jgi:hypothetical protein
VVINLVRPTPGGDLPMRRIFQDRQSNEISEVDLWKYGYDAATRPWYTQTMKLERAYVTEPYLSFSLGADIRSDGLTGAGSGTARFWSFRACEVMAFNESAIRLPNIQAIGMKAALATIARISPVSCSFRTL